MEILQDILLILSVALCAGTIFSYFNQSPIIAYILGGVFLRYLGDSFSAINLKSYLDIISELGVCFLLFSIGLEFSWTKLKSFGSRSLIIGLLQIVLTTLVFCLIFLTFTVSLKESSIIGFMLSLSSTACVLRILVDRAEIDAEYGRNSLTILLTQDIAVIPISIAVVLISGESSEAGLLHEILKLIGALIAIVITLFLIVNQIALKVLPKLSLNQNKELSVLLAVVLGIGSAWMAHAFKISPALGAFVTGMFLASSKFSHQIISNVSGFKIIFITLFFSSAGMRADLGWIQENILLVITSSIILIATKTIIIATILRFFTKSWAIGFSTGIAVSQIGEFAFVLGDIAFRLNSLSEENYQLIISVAITSMFFTPFLIKLTPLINNYINKSNKDFNSSKDYQSVNSPKICIVGYGPAGKQIADEFLSISEQICIIDLNVITLKEASAAGFRTILGDARQIEILELAKITSSEFLVVTVPDYDSASIILKNAKQISNTIYTVIRSRYDLNVPNFYAMGVDQVIAEEAEAGNKMIEAIKIKINT
jgi:CPA2 family monovalent cation:H+ antiporter-2